VIEVQDVKVDPETRRAWRGSEEIRLDPDSRRAWCSEHEITLSRKEFDLVHKLMSNAGVIVSRDELMRDVWHASFYTSSKTIDVHLGWVRRKLGDDPRHPHLITTVRGQGLRFEVEHAAQFSS